MFGLTWLRHIQRHQLSPGISRVHASPLPFPEMCFCLLFYGLEFRELAQGLMPQTEPIGNANQLCSRYPYGLNIGFLEKV